MTPHFSSAERAIRNAAVRRILFMQRVMKDQLGLEVQCGIESEVFVENAEGTPQEAVNRDGFATPWFSRLHRSENNYFLTDIGTDDAFDARRRSLVEIRSASEHVETDFIATPLMAAGFAAHIRQSLSDSLKSEGLNSLYSAYPDTDGRNAAAFHVAMCVRGAKPHGRAPSPYLFAAPRELTPERPYPQHVPSALFQHSAATLAMVQNAGAALFLPTENSYSRLRLAEMRDSTPMAVCVAADNKIANASICMRQSLESTGYRPEYFRLENRLPGADADPFLAVLGTHIALYDAVMRNVTPLKKNEEADPDTHETWQNGSRRLAVRRYDAKQYPAFSVPKLLLEIKPNTYLLREYPAFSLPVNRAEAAERFSRSAMMKELLGPELYGLVNEQQQALRPGRSR